MRLLTLSTFTDRNSRFLYPDIYLNSWDPYPLIYLQPEKDTPFKRNLLVYDVMTLQGEPSPPLRDKAFTSRAPLLSGDNDSMPSCIILPCRVEHPRVILRKGHTGVSFYFIFSGSVFVNVEELLLKTGHVMWHTAITLQRGDSFGVSAFKVHIREIKNYVYGKPQTSDPS